MILIETIVQLVIVWVYLECLLWKW